MCILYMYVCYNCVYNTHIYWYMYISIWCIYTFQVRTYTYPIVKPTIWSLPMWVYAAAAGGGIFLLIIFIIILWKVCLF